MYSVLNYKTPPFGLEEVAVWGAETSIELVGNFSYATSDNAKPLSRLCVDGVRDRLCADGVECVWAECQASVVQEETLVVVWAVLAGVVCVSLAAWGKRTPRYRRFVMLHRIRRAKPLLTQRWKPDGEAVDVPLGAGLSDEQLRSLRQSLGWLQAALDVVNEQQSRRTGYSQMLLRTPKYTATPIRTPHRSLLMATCR